MPKRHQTDDAFAQQYAALPLSEQAGEVRVLLVTSRDTGRWLLPKGWAEKRLGGPELAAKEAWEEAGVRGAVSQVPAGRYTYLKHRDDGSARRCVVDVFPLHVERLADAWPEQRQRRRAWFTLPQAAMAVAEPDLVTLLLRLELAAAAYSWPRVLDREPVA